MYQRAATGRRVRAHTRAPSPSPSYTACPSPPALALAVFSTLLFVAFTVARAGGRFAHLDLRIAARLVGLSDRHHLLRALHPLVHLGDLAFVCAVAGGASLILRLRGYRRAWSPLAFGLLSWPIELICKSIVPQPPILGSPRDIVHLGDLVRGPAATAFLDWLRGATPGGLDSLLRHAGSTALPLTSSYPSGSAARGTFVLGLLIWAALRARIPVLSALAALALLLPMAALGFSLVIFNWHWPVEVAGGYLLGLALLAAALAIIRPPPPRHAGEPPPPIPLRPRGPHSQQSPLPWIPNG